MKARGYRWSCLVALAVTPLLTSCSSDKSTSSEATVPARESQQAMAVDGSSAAVIRPGVPGGIFVQTYELTADVAKIDAKNRIVTLVDSAGKKQDVTCGPEVKNFDQIRVGDRVKCVATEELVVAMASDAAPADAAAGGVMLATAPKGAKPAAVAAATVEFIATVSAIDQQNRRATLRLPDGTSRVVAVRDDIDLSRRRVGERVVIRATQSMAIAVDKP